MSNAADPACLCGKCTSCVIFNRSVCHAASPEAMAQLNRISHVRKFVRGTVIQGQGEASDIVGNIIEGVVKLSSASANGDDHIVGLCFLRIFSAGCLPRNPGLPTRRLPM